MKTKMKKLFALFLTIVMLLSVSPAIYAAEIIESGSFGNNATYTLDSDGVLTVSGTGNAYGILPFTIKPKIKSIVIEEGITEIDWYDFRFITANEMTLSLPLSLKKIGRGAFNDSNIKEVYIPANVSEIEPTAFASSYIERFIVDENNPYFMTTDDGVLMSKDGKTLYQYPGAKKDESFTVYDGVETICSNAFAHTSYLKTCIMSSSVKTLENEAFCDSSVTNVDLGTVEDIGEASFEHSKIENIEIPSTVKILHRDLFNGSSLKSLTLNEGLEEIEYGVFSGTYIEELNLPSTLKTFDTSWNTTDTIKKLSVDENNPYFVCVDGVMFTRDMKTLVLYPSASDAGSYAIPDGIETVRAFAFAYSKNLKTVTGSDSVKKIENYTFYYSGINSADGFCKVEEIGYNAFCHSAIEAFVIPDATTKLGYDAFMSCENLKEITIGKQIRHIESWTFYSCSSLKDVYYTGTYDDWNGIVIDSLNEPLLKAKLHIEHDHVPVYFPAEKNCMKTGHTDGYTCELCGELLSGNEEIPTRYYHSDDDGDGVCDFCGIGKEDWYSSGEHFYFGTYPQTKVAEDWLIKELNSRVSEEDWKSYHYSTHYSLMKYNGGAAAQTDYMQYADITLGGDTYRAVRITERDGNDPLYGGRTYTASRYGLAEISSIGVFTTYNIWYKFEPVEWVVLDGETKLAATAKILDSQPMANDAYYYYSGNPDTPRSERKYYADSDFTHYLNDYSVSYLRTWLNENFLETAFTQSEVQSIPVTEIMTDYGTVINDRLFAPSYDEASSPYFSTGNDKKQCTDYAISQGASFYTTLRTAADNSTQKYAGSFVGAFDTRHGIRPAMKITGMEFGHFHRFNVTQNTPATCTEGGSMTFTCSCGETKTEPLLPLGHTANKHNPCTEDEICTVCSELMKEAPGHNYVLYDHYTSGTCTTNAVDLMRCTVCGDTEYVEVPDSYQHSFSHITEYPATCTENARSEETCDLCGERIVTEYPDTMLPHTDKNNDAKCDMCGLQMREQTIADKIREFINKIMDFFKQIFGR